ncbi:MAG: hypothetical protein ACO3A4_09480 [Silvanigrellaceae bacterium]
MRTLLNDLLNKPREKQVVVNLEQWFKPMTSMARHLSQISPNMNFEAVSRHAADAICQALAPLQPMAAHFHIDVSVSHLWLPDPTFKLDSFFRLQNRIVMPSQTRPVETSRDDLFKTHVIVPFELHKHAIEILVYHKEDAQLAPTVQQTVEVISETYSHVLTQALLMREEHLLNKEQWEKQSEKQIGSRLGGAIYQVQSPFLFAQSLRGFSLTSSQDASEHIFLSQNTSLDLLRFILFKKGRNVDGESSTSRSIAFVSALAAQLRFFEHTSSLTSFQDFLKFFSQCIDSLSHLLTHEDELSFSVGELSQKQGIAKWHNAGFPSPIVFGDSTDSIKLPTTTVQKPFNLSSTYDWSRINQASLPAGNGLFFVTENIFRRLGELNLSSNSFFDRIRNSLHAANLVIEAEQLLSRPDSSRVVAASVPEWSSLPYDISMVALFNNATRTQLSL